MIIDEARFAAATLTADGAAHKFDDIGDMLAYHREHPELAVRAWFVHDYETETWLRGETAYYVVSPEIASPMGHGIAAFAEQAKAEAFSLEHETLVVAFDDLPAENPSAAHGR
jgi:copper chaperone NosL